MNVVNTFVGGSIDSASLIDEALPQFDLTFLISRNLLRGISTIKFR